MKWKDHGDASLLKTGALTFAIHSLHGFSILRSEIILLFAKVCYTFEEKNFVPPSFCEKWRPKLSKNEPVCTCNIRWCVRLRQEISFLHEGRATVSNTSKGVEQKRVELKQ